MSHFNLKRYFVIALSIVMLVGIGVFYFSQEAQAFRVFVDGRYHFNHSYIARGQFVRVLPGGWRVAWFNHAPFYFAHGVWYRPYGGRYVVIAPPIGVFVPESVNVAPVTEISISSGSIPGNSVVTIMLLSSCHTLIAG